MIRLSRRTTDTAEKSYGMCDKGAAFVPQEGLIHLELGRPHYDTPQHIKDATISALQAGEVHYSDMQGNVVVEAGSFYGECARHFADLAIQTVVFV